MVSGSLHGICTYFRVPSGFLQRFWLLWRIRGLVSRLLPWYLDKFQGLAGYLLARIWTDFRVGAGYLD